MKTCNIYINTFYDDIYSFGYRLLIKSGEYTRTLQILCHLCPAVSCFGNSKGNYDEIEEIAKVINSYEHVTVYYDPNLWDIDIILDYLKEHCKYAKFKNMILYFQENMIKKEYAELNRPSELIIDKAEYLKILKEADELLLLIKKALGKDV